MFNLFKKDKVIEETMQENALLRGLINELQREIDTLKVNHKDTTDLVRESLGIIPYVNVYDLKADGFPPNYMPADRNSDVYKAKLGELAMIYHNQTFKDMIRYLVDYQGNYCLRFGDTHEKTINARYFIEGIHAVWHQIMTAHEALNRANKEDSEPVEDGETVHNDLQEQIDAITENILSTN